MTLQDNLWEQLKILIDSTDVTISKNLQQNHGISATEYRALKFLSQAPNTELRMQELARLLGLNQSSVTRLVERLEKNSFTTRDICAADKRGVYTVLTKKGGQLQKTVEKDYMHYLQTALNDAGRSEENSKIIRHLQNILSENPPHEI